MSVQFGNHTSIEDAFRASAEEQKPHDVLSPWLYFGGLVVSLSGLYAVSYDAANTTFEIVAMGLTAIGYIISFILRLNRISLKSLQVPLFVCLLLVALSSILSGQGFAWTGMFDSHDTPTKHLQVLIAGLAILQAFTLNSDAAVLFSSVPAMTMLALVSSATPDDEVQNAFLLFIAGITFLMIHENYLRTRGIGAVNRSSLHSRKMFGGQLLLMAVCFVGALALANVVAIPMSIVGRQLNPRGAFSDLTAVIKPNATGSNSIVGEASTLELARGPVTSSDIPLLQVTVQPSDPGLNWPLYWRGTTYDRYTGHTFEKSEDMTDPITVTEDAQSTTSGSSERPINDPMHDYTVPANAFDFPQTGVRLEQKFTVMNGSIDVLYAAGTTTHVTVPSAELKYDRSSTVHAVQPLTTKQQYTIIATAVNPALSTLRQASEADPPEITYKYVALTNQISPRVRSFVSDAVEGATNRYDRALAIQHAISSACKYNLQATAVPSDKDVVDYFLFESKMGYCDSFAATMTVLCRTIGIPARLASGFLTGDEDAGNHTYTLRDKHKHVWTEVFFPNIGWIPFDATDGAEDVTPKSPSESQNHIGFVAWLLRQPRAVQVMGMGAAGLFLFACASELITRRRPAKRGGPAVSGRPANNLTILAVYADVCTLLGRLGVKREPSMTPEEFRQHLDRVPEWAGAGIAVWMDTLTELQSRCCYSTHAATDTEVKQAREARAALKAIVPRLRRIKG